MNINTKLKIETVAFTVVWVICMIGWGANAVKLVDCDFKQPYKEEVIRGIGVFVIPLGAVAGVIDIEDE